MSHQPETPTDPKPDPRMQRAQNRHRRIEHFFRNVLHFVELLIAALTILVILAAIGYEIYQMCVVPGYVFHVNNYLHSALTIVVGLEFVRMIIDTTPANILEVLTVAITRHVILNHDNPWSTLACTVCIAGLFSIRRFLIRRSELKEEMVETE